MKIIIPLILFLFTANMLPAQELDSIYFNLYTDSLKKGTYNYINVEGRFTDGTYLPLSDKELKLSSSEGKFSRNSLFIDTSYKGEKVTVKAVLIKNPRYTKEIEIYIKKYESNERLPSVDEIMNNPRRRKQKK